MTTRKKITTAFLAGALMGLVIYHGSIVFGGKILIDGEFIERQREQMALLEQENQELTDELFRPRGPGTEVLVSEALPYDADADAQEAVNAAKAAAAAEGKFLMVTFGANWCLDCRTLYYRLNSEPVASYANEFFRFVHVDVGKFNRNREVAEALGVSLKRGIPVAVFFGPDGRQIGTTNDGQLEPARHYSSKQILKFVRDIAEHSRILAPDSVD